MVNKSHLLHYINKLPSRLSMTTISREDTTVALTVLFYMTTSISMVMLNKVVLNTVDMPIFFLWWQLVVAVLFLHAFSLFGLIKLPFIKMDKAVQLLPLVLVNAVGLSANTYCLQFVDASLFQVFFSWQINQIR